MNKLEQLIQELCPNGVEYKKLGEVAEIGTGSSNGNEAEENGLYPFFIRSKNIKSKNSYQFDEEAIIPGEGGIGDIFHYTNGKYALHQRVYRIHFLVSFIYVKFIYYYMISNFKTFITKKAVNATVTSIRKPMIEDFLIPVPPLEIQKEIVRILDTFTELEKELEKELEARKKQYEFYREQLLSFDESVNWIQLGDCIEKNIGGGTPSKTITSYWNGTIPWVSVKDIVATSMYLTIHQDTITTEGLNNSSSNLIEEEKVLIATRISPGAICINKYPVAINQDLRGLYLNNKLIKNKFLVYFFKTLSIQGKGTTVKGISVEELEKIKIPLPPLEEQERIVNILDRFDALCNDLTCGLPAEIEARRKQYAYYRDKLLTFKNISDKNIA